ncbi:DsbC family protein [Spongiibacter sp. KMU-158]|uniref:Thiol:disulfide interchange protein n=1 Tax=Spongiibacter pelagi TaxID=2760804 RepID=A0A927GY83_9GAMM|nr:DsbC family protein [Spongiibacter pelagi]MBD2860179.1 DsbC family protein [Spongiibacter pelagi]
MNILSKRSAAVALFAVLGSAAPLLVSAQENEGGIVSKIKGFFGDSEVQVEVNAGVESGAVQAITAAFSKSRPGLRIETIAKSEFPGLYDVQFKNGPQVISNENGQYFIVGEVYENTENGIENVAERKLMPMRAKLLAEVDAKDMITFSPKGETKGVMYVFTDVDCGYCQKLHREVPELNANGIEVRYLAFPRAGQNSPTYNKMVTAWCADDRQQAMNVLKSRGQVAIKTCEPNPVQAQYQLGVALGVTGTPAIVTQSGKLIPGYRPAKDLVAIAVE